ncbi:hypothetical protein ZIOFF_044886 [Zingiber officinale]|uniref:RING-type domain-containing protein n=1 Tax=Zingiber officinale TaxID=94328 RepID=A0A8J5G1Z7_ZINOF|nr:hypothetical protein ZIOFF_044886 [Zingiber officinale]
MDPFAWSINADNSAPSTVIPGWEADVGGVILSIEARVVLRLLAGDQDMMPPQLISHFCRRRIPFSDDVTAEHSHFTIPQPYYHINNEPAWEVQTQGMLYRVAANHVRPADLDLLARAFRTYTYAVLDLFPITDLVVMEFFSVIEIPDAPSSSDGHLRYLIPLETYEYFFEDDDDVDVVQFGRGPWRASAEVVEGLRMVTTTREDTSCPICLDDFEEMSQVLAMSCGHPFHEGCLLEWLKRSNSCPPADSHFRTLSRRCSGGSSITHNHLTERRTYTCSARSPDSSADNLAPIIHPLLSSDVSISGALERPSQCHLSQIIRPPPAGAGMGKGSTGDVGACGSRLHGACQPRLYRTSILLVHLLLHPPATHDGCCLSSIIFVRTNYPTTIGLLNISDDDDNDEDNDDDDDEDDDDDDDDEDDYFDLVVDDDNFVLVVDDEYHAYFDRGSRPASATAVEGLEMVTAEESDSCSICLEDLGMTTPVLAMPCSHLFHPRCLKKWLERSCSCPLCRFSLRQEQWVSCAPIIIKSILILGILKMHFTYSRVFLVFDDALISNDLGYVTGGFSCSQPCAGGFHAANLVLAALQATNRMLAALPAASMRSAAVLAVGKWSTTLPTAGSDCLQYGRLSTHNWLLGRSLAGNKACCKLSKPIFSSCPITSLRLQA